MFKCILRITLLFFHAFQLAVSAIAGGVISLWVAVLLIGTHILPPDYMKEKLKVKPLNVSLVGTVVWFTAGFMELGFSSPSI